MKKLVTYLSAGFILFTTSLIAKGFTLPEKFHNYQEKAICIQDGFLNRSQKKYWITLYHLDGDGRVDVIETNKTEEEKEFGGMEVIQPPCQTTYILENKFYIKGKCE